MPYPDALLDVDERVALRQHPHWQRLLRPAFSAVLIIAAAVVVWVFAIPSPAPDHSGWIVLGAALAAIVIFTAAPVLGWANTHLVLTTRHIFVRRGVLSRSGHQIPLSRVQGVEQKVSFGGRLLGYGTILVESASADPACFRCVTNPTKVHSLLNDLIAGRWDPDDDGLGESGKHRTV